MTGKTLKAIRAVAEYLQGNPNSEVLTNDPNLEVSLRKLFPGLKVKLIKVALNENAEFEKRAGAK